MVSPGHAREDLSRAVALRHGDGSFGCGLALTKNLTAVSLRQHRELFRMMPGAKTVAPAPSGCKIEFFLSCQLSTLNRLPPAAPCNVKPPHSGRG